MLRDLRVGQNDRTNFGRFYGSKKMSGAVFLGRWDGGGGSSGLKPCWTLPNVISTLLPKITSQCSSKLHWRLMPIHIQITD